jgi:hypothetical protein
MFILRTLLSTLVLEAFLIVKCKAQKLFWRILFVKQKIVVWGTQKSCRFHGGFFMVRENGSFFIVKQQMVDLGKFSSKNKN